MDDLELKEIGEDNSLLLVDDDEPFVRRLARAMEKRGFEPLIAQSVAEGRVIVATAATAGQPDVCGSGPLGTHSEGL